MAQAPVPLAGGFDVGADLAVRVEEGEAAEPEARVLADARRARPRRARCRPRRRSPPSRGARPSLLDVAQPARAPPNATETLEIALPDDVVDDDVREVAAEVVDAEARLRGDDVDDGQEARAPRPVERVFGRGERGRDVRRRRAVALRQDDAVRHLRGTRIFDPTSTRAISMPRRDFSCSLRRTRFVARAPGEHDSSQHRPNRRRSDRARGRSSVGTAGTGG